MEEDTPLGRLLALRHASAHRFFVARHALAPPSSEWLERLEWTELTNIILTQIGVARAALVYLVRAVDAHEAQVADRDANAGFSRGALHVSRVNPEFSEID